MNAERYAELLRKNANLYHCYMNSHEEFSAISKNVWREIESKKLQDAVVDRLMGRS